MCSLDLDLDLRNSGYVGLHKESCVSVSFQITLSVRVGGRLSVVRVWVGGSGDGVDSCVKFRDLT